MKQIHFKFNVSDVKIDLFNGLFQQAKIILRKCN